MIPLALATQAAIWIVLCVLLYRTGKINIYHPLFYYLIFHGLVFVARPILVWALEINDVFEYMKFTPGPEIWLKTLGVTSVGLVVFVVSVILTQGKTELRPLNVGIDPLQYATFLVTVAFFAPYIAYSGFSSFTTGIQGERVGGTYIMVNTTGYIVEGYTCMVPLALVFYKRAGFRWWAITPLAVFCLVRMYAGWGRAVFVFSALAAGLCYLQSKRRTSFEIKWVLLFLLLLPIFVKIGESRTYVSEVLSGTYQSQEREEKNWRDRIPILDFSNFDFLTYIVNMVPDVTGRYSLGVQHLQIFTEPIPRILWRNKPIGVPIEFFDLNDYGNFLGLTNSVVGDGWISGGWTGVIVSMGVIGAGMGRIYRYYKEHQRSIFVIFAYITFIAYSLQLYRDGSINVLKPLFFQLLPILFWYGIWRLVGGQAPRGISPLLLPKPPGARWAERK